MAGNRSPSRALSSSSITGNSPVSSSSMNLPAGLLAGSVVSASHVPQQVASAVLIGVDLGPNLSVTGSLRNHPLAVRLRREIRK